MVSWGPFTISLILFWASVILFVQWQTHSFFPVYNMCFPAVRPIGSIFVIQQFIDMFGFCCAHTEGTRSHMHSAYQLLRQAWYLPRKTDNPDGTMKVDVEETDYCALAQLWTAEWLRFGMFEKMKETINEIYHCANTLQHLYTKQCWWSVYGSEVWSMIFTRTARLCVFT